MRSPINFRAVAVVAFSFAFLPSLARASCTGTSTSMSCVGPSITAPAGNTVVKATPYPSQNTVSGMSGSISSLTVTLNITHTGMQDLGFLLVDPTGAKNLVFMSSSGGFNPVTNLTITLDDNASSALTVNGTPTNNTSYKPTALTSFSGTNYTWPTPAPAAPLYAQPADVSGTHTLNGIFGGLASANGVWQLFIVTGCNNCDSGTINSWTLNITTAVAASPTNTSLAALPAQVFTAAPNNTTTFTAMVTSSGSPVTTGTVAFKVNGTTLTGCGAVALGTVAPNIGKAACTASFSSEGVHTIGAFYSGASGFSASNGSTGVQVDNHPTVTGNLICNPGAITIAKLGAVAPYGSHLFVPTLSGSAVSAVSLQLNNVTYDDPSAIEVLLVSPGGTHFFVPFHKVGINNANSIPVSGINVTLSDGAAAQAPISGALGSGTFLPAAYSSPIAGWPSPAPSPVPTSDFAASIGGATFTSIFGGLDPAGTTPNNFWSLYIVNGFLGSSGSIGNWCLNFTTSGDPATTTVVSSTPNPSLTGAAVTFTAHVTKQSDSSNITSGTVTIKEGPTVLQAATALNGSGIVTFTTSALAEGMHTIVAQYNGSPGIGNVSNGTTTQQVDTPTVVTNNNTTFCNPGGITIPNGLKTAATPYPSRITVSNAAGTINHMTVNLKGFTKGDPSSTDVLLVGPQPTSNLVLMSDAGGSNAAPFSVNNINLTIDDAASGKMPQIGQLLSQSYQPTYFNTANFTFPAPAPVAPNTNVSIGSQFSSKDPNGIWQLYTLNDFQLGVGSFSSWCLNFTENPPVLSIAQTHAGPGTSGHFVQGQQGTYTITVTNNGPGPTGGTTTVTDTLPAHMTAAGLAGAPDWTCTTSPLQCTSAVAKTGAYSNITLTVNVDGTAPTSLTNTANASGGGDTTAGGHTHMDVTAVDPAPVLSIVTGHTGTFTRGSTGEWDVTVSNAAGSSPAIGTVTVVETLPTGYTLNSFASTGNAWTCGSVTNTVTCTANPGGGIAGGASFAQLKAIVNIPANSSANVSDNFTFYGGGDLNHTQATPGTGSDSVSVVSPALPTPDSVTGMSPGSLSQTLTLKYSSVNGFGYLKNVVAILSAPLLGAKACGIAYDTASNRFYLSGDGTSATQGPLTPGANSTLTDAECTLNGVGSSATGLGNTLTVVASVTFKAAYGASQNINMQATDLGGQSSGYLNKGTTAPNPATPPTADSVSGVTANSLTEAISRSPIRV